MLAARPILAQENSASPWPTSTTAEAGFNLGYGNDQIAERATERIIDHYVSFEPSKGDRSSRYNVSLDLENEDSDWSFEVTITMEF
jgi:hypothetical protein